MSNATPVHEGPRRLAPFVLLEAASMVSFMGGSMVFLLLPWLAVALTGSATSAGLVVSIASVPGLLLSPLMGSFIDRFGRRRSAILMELLPAIVNLSIPLLALVMPVTVPILLTIAIVRSVVGGSAPSARKSLIPDVAGPAKITLEKANSIHESIAAAGFAIGPFLGSLFIGWIGAVNTFYVVSGAGFVGALVVSFIRVHEHKEEHADDEGRNWFVYAVQGFKIMFQTPAVAVLMTSFAVLSTIYLPTEVVLLPKYYNSIHFAAGYGQVIGIMAAFVTIGSLGFERLSKRFSFASLLRFAIIGVPLTMIPMAFLPPQWAMLLCGALLGVAWGPLPALVNTVILRKVAPSKRGRVFALEMTIWTGGPMLSMTVAGIAVDAFGVKPVYMFIALTVLAAGILISTRKAVRELDVAEFQD